MDSGRSGLHQDVVFADLNLKLNLLWVSLRPRPGAISELVAAIRLRVPEALLVAHYAEPRSVPVQGTGRLQPAERVAGGVQFTPDGPEYPCAGHGNPRAFCVSVHLKRQNSLK